MRYLYQIRARSALVPFAIGCFCAVGCGGAQNRHTGLHAKSNPNTTKSSAETFSPSTFGDYDPDDYYHNGRNDGDNDDRTPTDRDGDSDNSTGSYFDSDDDVVRHFGHAANPVEKRAVTAVLKRYYAAAIAMDGTSACKLIVTPIVDSVPETLGGPAGPAYLRGSKTCPEIMTKLFRENYKQLSTYAELLQIDAVRIGGDRATVVMRFKGHPGRQISFVLERGTWKLESLVDGELP